VVVGVLGVAAAGGGLAFGRAAVILQQHAFQLCPDPAVSCGAADQANRELERSRVNALYANLSYGAAGAILVTGIVLWATGDSARNDDRIAIMPRLGESSGVDVQVRF
jgi:hypothetical protein